MVRGEIQNEPFTSRGVRRDVDHGRISVREVREGLDGPEGVLRSPDEEGLERAEEVAQRLRERLGLLQVADVAGARDSL